MPCQFIVFKIFINDKMALLTGKILMTCPTNQLEINYIFQKTAYLSKKGCTAKLSSFSSSFNVFFQTAFWSGPRVGGKGNDSFAVLSKLIKL